MPDLPQRMRRRKPWYRPRNIILFLLAVTATIVVRVCFMGLASTPGHAVDYNQLVLDLARGAQPAPAREGEDAWPLLTRAIELHETIVDDVTRETMSAKPSPDLDLKFIAYDSISAPAPTDSPEPGDDRAMSDDEQQRAAAAAASLQANQDIARRGLELMRDRGVVRVLEAVSQTRFALRPKGTGIILARVHGDISAIRLLATASAARMTLALAASDHDEYAAAFEQALALGRILAQQAWDIDRLLGYGCSSTVLRRLDEDLAGGRIPPALCRRLLAALDRQTPPPSITIAIESARLTYLDVIQATHSDDGHGSGIRLMSVAGKFLPRGSSQRVTNPTSKLGDVLWFLYPSKAELVASGNEYYDSLVHAAGVALRPDRLKAPDPAASLAALPSGHDILKTIGELSANLVFMDDQFRTELAGARVLLAIETHRQEHAAPPPSLDDLVPEILPSLPIDPLAADGKLVYRVLATPDALGRTYLLYSVGSNAVDDAGVPHPDAPIRALGRSPQIPSDYIFNTPP